MAARAGGHVDQVVAVKGPLAVVALVAVVRRSDVVLLRGDIRDLTALLALTNVVAFVAALARMRGVREYGLKDVTRLRRAAVGSDRMTNRARADLALGRVTAKAIVVGLKPHRNVPARTREIVTSDAALRRSCIAFFVHRMVEFHVEALESRKWLQSS